MIKIKLEIEMEVDPQMYDLSDEGEKEWFTQTVLAPENVMVFSKEIGDFICEETIICKVEILENNNVTKQD